MSLSQAGCPLLLPNHSNKTVNGNQDLAEERQRINLYNHCHHV